MNWLDDAAHERILSLRRTPGNYQGAITLDNREWTKEGA